MNEHLRQHLIQQRLQQAKEDVHRKSILIIKKLQTLPVFQQAHTILFYVSYDNEVYTHDIIKQYLQTETHVCVPKSEPTTQLILCSQITNFQHLIPGTYNILEPKHEHLCIIAPTDLDVIIVPGVAFDLKGNRIGHGKGYYDRLLKQAPQAHKIGLAFDFQIVDTLTPKKHDIPMDTIVTEKRIITCQQS